MGRHSSNSSRRSGRDVRRTESQPTLNRRAQASRGRDDVLNEIADLSYDSPRSRRAGSLERAPERLQDELKRRRHRGRKTAAAIGITILALIVIAGIAGAVYYFRLQNKVQQTVDNKGKLKIDLAEVKQTEPYNMLIMGYDKRTGETQYRSDTMLLAHINPQKKKVWLISLPRDYKVQIPGHGTRKLNAAYSFGQEELAIQTVEDLTGQTINHYMGVDFQGFKAIVNAMGGVEVNVPQKIYDPKADNTKGDKAATIDAGLQVLDGDHALVFVRTRKFADADFSRMKDQQIFFKALANQATKLSVTKLPSLVTAIAPYLSTDMTLLELMSTAKDLKGAGADNIYTATLPGKWVSPYIVPDETAKAELLKKFENEQPFEDSSDSEDKEVTPAEVKVTVRNGTTTAGLAKQAASILKTRGFNVGEVGNTEQQNVYDQTLVIYKTKKEQAELIAKYLQPGVKLVQSRGMYSFSTETMVVIGKDWDIEKLPVTTVTSK